jgi:hypothetical protein
MLLSNITSLCSRFTNSTIHIVAQNAAEALLCLPKQAVRLPIKPATNRPIPKVDPFGIKQRKYGRRLKRKFAGLLVALAGTSPGTTSRGQAKQAPGLKKLLAQASTRCRRRFEAEGAMPLQKTTPDLLLDSRFSCRNGWHTSPGSIPWGQENASPKPVSLPAGSALDAGTRSGSRGRCLSRISSQTPWLMAAF